ncbi:efflux RND transporter periplasmic adaptor subunit [Shigella flexneri]
MKKSILTILLSSIIITGCNDNNKKSNIKTPPLNVSYVEVVQKNIPIEQEFSGRVVSYMTSEIRPQISGIIKKRSFTEGQMVKEGDILYEIEPETYQAAYNQALANLSQLKSALNVASLKSKRYSMLIKNASVSQQDYDDAQSTYQQAKFNVDAAKATLETARINLERTKIKAPISGKIGISSVTPGSLITAEQSTPLSIIRSIDKVYVDFTQTSIDLLKLKKKLLKDNENISDTEVSLMLEDGTEYPLKGKLSTTEVAVNEGTGSVIMRSVFENPDHLLLPGAFARVKLSQYEQKAVLVPQQAIMRSGEGRSQAYVIDGNKVKLVQLSAKENLGDNWVVTEGLKNNDKVVIEGISKLKDGQEVSPVEYKKSQGDK